MRIAVGSDHRGVEMRGKLVELLVRLGQEVVDLGSHGDEAVDYPDIAAEVGRKVSKGDVDRGILICGSGLGMCIAANKIRGVRAAPCYDDVTAELSRRHNDLNVLCLSGDMLGDRLVDRLVEIWLNTPFDGGRHARRLAKISEMELRNGKHGSSDVQGGLPSPAICRRPGKAVLQGLCFAHDPADQLELRRAGTLAPFE